MAELEDEIKAAAKIIDFLGLAQEGFDLFRYKEALKQKTLDGALTLRDALFITLNEKGLKILEKSFVQDSNLEMVAKIFPSTTNIDIPGGGTLAVSPEPTSAMANWSTLINKIKKKTGQDEKEILNTPIQSYIREGVPKEFDMESAKGGASALRQGIFYARKQLGFSEKEKKIIRDTYLDDIALRQELGGSKTYGQKRLEGRALSTRNIRPSDAPLITQAVKEGMSVITDADAKAAIMYNILIPHRTVQVSRLRINPERDAKGNILKDATDPYLDGDQIVVPQEGAKKGQKRYTTVKLTPFMQNFLGQIAANNPDRTFLFRDNNVAKTTFEARINNALQLPGGVGEKTQALVDKGIFRGAVSTFGMLRKLSATSTALYVPGSFGNLRYIMGHTSLKQVASETGIDEQQKIFYIGDIQEGRSDFEVMKLYEDELQKNSGASSKRDLLRNTFNISEIDLPNSFTDPAITETQGRDLAKNVLQEVEFDTQLNNRPDLSFESKLWIIENLKTPEAFKAFEDQIEQAQKAVGSESVDSLDQIIQRKINPELKVDSSVQEVIKELEAPEAPSKPSVMPEPVVTSPESDFDFTDTPQEDIPQTAQDARRRASEFFEDEQQKRDFLSRMGKGVTKLGLAALGGGAGVLATIGDAAADVALSPTEVAYGGLDPAEEIMGRAERRSLFASDDMSDTELLERMQAASSQRLSPDMAERTTALADIEANRGRLEERGFSPIARQQVEQSQRDQRESGLGDYGETTQAESMRQLFSELQDVDTSEAFTQEARKARIDASIDERIQRAKIAAEAAQIFNR
mgnify:FL=1|tara:strand:+ start:808 stop:3225 length:2418 start_codon:yes stop_codon:yes gene_type:complete